MEESLSMWESLPYSEKTVSVLQKVALGGAMGFAACTAKYTVDLVFDTHRPQSVVDCVGIVGLGTVAGASAALGMYIAIAGAIEMVGDWKWRRELDKAAKDNKGYHEYPNMDLYPKFDKEDEIVVDGEAPQVVEEDTDGEGRDA